MPDPNDGKPCVICGAPFTPYRASSMTCSVDCRRVRQRHVKRARLEADPERLREINRRWVARHRDELVERRREAYRANPERFREERRRYRERHPDTVKESKRRAYQANPGATIASNRRRRARQADALVHDVPDAAVWELNPAGPGRCNYCGRALSFEDRRSWHVDHVVPLSRGGLHEVGNLVIACAFCNGSKGARLLSEWVRRPAAVADAIAE